MLIVKVKGGLGNQLFQYSLALQLLQSGKHVSIDKTAYQNDKYKRTYLLGLLPNRIPVMEDETVKKLSSPKLAYRLSRLFSGVKRIKRFKETYDNSWRQAINLSDAHDCLIDGYWQSAEMVAAAPLLLQDLRALRDTVEIPVEMKAANVAIHIRQGFNNDAHGNKITDHAKKGTGLFSLDSGYYARAIAEIQRTIQNPVFAIFGDDEEWCRGNILPMATPGSVVIPQGDDWQDMLLMSNFQAIICANSTFSWWSAMLCEGTVIAPDEWSKDKQKTAVIHAAHWRRL